MDGFFSRSLVPPAPHPGPVSRDLALEGMRGLCALLVMYGHAFAPIPVLDRVYSPPDPFSWLEMARIAVLFFFVLSGYVIGLTVRTEFTAPAARGYLGRRLLRLVPVNTAAVLIAWALAPRTGLGTVLGNLGFLQNYNPYFFGWRVPIMANDASLWTLNFELFYYLLFLAVWRYAPRAGLLIILLAAGSVGAAVCAGFPQFLSCYAVGALYWFAGLAVAWLGSRGSGHGNWPSALLVAAVMWPLDPLGKLFAARNLTDYGIPSVSLQRLDLLPVCLWLLLAISGRAPRWHRPLTVACLLWASLAWVLRYATRDFGDKSQGAYYAYFAAIFLAWMWSKWKPEPVLLAKLAPVGLVSFGLYAVSLALQFGILTWPSLPMGSAWTYALRLAILVGLSFAIAWLLERRLQPALRRRLRPARRAA
jgi:hypothetical protein